MNIVFLDEIRYTKTSLKRRKVENTYEKTDYDADDENLFL